MIAFSSMGLYDTPDVTSKSKKDSNDRESIQSSTTPVPGYRNEKKQNHNKHHKQEPRVSHFPSGDHMAASTRRKSMKNTRNKQHK